MNDLLFTSSPKKTKIYSKTPQTSQTAATFNLQEGHKYSSYVALKSPMKQTQPSVLIDKTLALHGLFCITLQSTRRVFLATVPIKFLAFTPFGTSVQGMSLARPGHLQKLNHALDILVSRLSVCPTDEYSAW